MVVSGDSDEVDPELQNFLEDQSKKPLIMLHCGQQPYCQFAMAQGTSYNKKKLYEIRMIKERLVVLRALKLSFWGLG
jgi:hypothetical protein